MSANELKVSTRAFQPNQPIPVEFTREGRDRSPELLWEGAPGGTLSFVLVMDDPDAPGGTFTHWVLYDIPAVARGLTQGRDGGGGIGGRNDFDHDRYRGPCPPPGHGEHRYRFHVYALDIPSLELPPGAPRGEVEDRMAGHVLAEGEIVGRFAREG